MAEGSAQYHEPVELLSPGTMERHRAIVSLIEELEAVDWYQQRIDATEDDGLAAILAHNRDEEKEHAAMSLEWLRRQDPDLDAKLRTYLFTEGPITEIEEKETSEGHAGAASADGSLRVGSLREQGDL